MRWLRIISSEGMDVSSELGDNYLHQYFLNPEYLKLDRGRERMQIIDANT